MFCGDETGGVVIDVGNYTCKFGYAGDDVPKAIFPGVRDNGGACARLTY
jgi:actin-related protein